MNVSQKKSLLQTTELKYYLQQQILYETQKIKSYNSHTHQFFQQLIAHLQNILTKQIPQILEVKVFGSFATNLNFPQSDIDLVLIPSASTQIFELFQRVLLCLNTLPTLICSCKLIKTAFIPLIKAQSTQRYYKKKIDISIQGPNHNGVQFSQLTKVYLKYYPALQPLLLILKKYMYECGLHSPYTGGLSSSSLLFMVVAHLQHHYHYHHHQNSSLSQLLLSFFNFYGFKMDYVNKCIVVDNPETMKEYKGCVYRDVSEYSIEPKLVILDPISSITDNPAFNCSNCNVARATHKIKQIRKAFQIAYLLLHTNRNCNHSNKCQLHARICQIDVPVQYKNKPRPCCLLKRLFKNANKINQLHNQ